MTAALMRSGAVELVARALLRSTRVHPRALLFALLLTVGTLSSFVSNTAAAAFFVPVAIGLAEKVGVSPSRFLLPVAFAAILSSSVALISTSTNVVASGLMASLGLDGFRMFELSVVGVPILLLGLARTNSTSAGQGRRRDFSQNSLMAQMAWVELEREKRRSVLRWRKYWRSSSGLTRSGARPKCSPNWRTQAR